MGHPRIVCATRHAEIEGRVKEIRSQVDKTTSDYDREKLQERCAETNADQGDGPSHSSVTYVLFT